MLALVPSSPGASGMIEDEDDDEDEKPWSRV
jgi:hypothetical protein